MLPAQRRGGARRQRPQVQRCSTTTLASTLAGCILARVSNLPSPPQKVQEEHQIHDWEEHEVQDEHEVQEEEDLGPPEEESVEKWVQLIGGPFTEEDQLCADVRRLQQRSGCSDVTCDEIVELFRKYLGMDVHFKSYDAKMEEQAGFQMLRLNGCPNCKQHVYLPSDKDKQCPICGHNRYDESGKPLEVLRISFNVFLSWRNVFLSCREFPPNPLLLIVIFLSCREFFISPSRVS